MMITCINLSHPRKLVKNTYDDIALSYKLKYNKNQREAHKRFLVKCVIAGTTIALCSYISSNQAVYASNEYQDLLQQINQGHMQTLDGYIQHNASQLTPTEIANIKSYASQNNFNKAYELLSQYATNNIAPPTAEVPSGDFTVVDVAITMAKMVNRMLQTSLPSFFYKLH
jgi:hypothetical protein